MPTTAIRGRCRFGGVSAASVASCSSCAVGGAALHAGGGGGDRIHPPPANAPSVTAPTLPQTTTCRFMDLASWSPRCLVRPLFSSDVSTVCSSRQDQPYHCMGWPRPCGRATGTHPILCYGVARCVHVRSSACVTRSVALRAVRTGGGRD